MAMTIQNNSSSIKSHSSTSFQPQVKAAPGGRSASQSAFSAAAAHTLNSYGNQALDHVSALRSGHLPSLDRAEQILGGLGHHATDSALLQMRLNDATAPRLTDNKGAGAIRDRYRQTAQEAREAQMLASQQAQGMGDGRHSMKDGSTVTVATNPFTGRQTVTTLDPKGVQKTVNIDPNDPNYVQVDTKYPNGTSEHLEQDGDRISKSGSLPGPMGFKLPAIREDFHLNGNGEPVSDFYLDGEKKSHTVVHSDGSTDQERLAYKDLLGNPVFETIHDGPRKFGLMPGCIDPGYGQPVEPSLPGFPPLDPGYGVPVSPNPFGLPIDPGYGV